MSGLRGGEVRLTAAAIALGLIDEVRMFRYPIVVGGEDDPGNGYGGLQRLHVMGEARKACA